MLAGYIIPTEALTLTFKMAVPKSQMRPQLLPSRQTSLFISNIPPETKNNSKVPLTTDRVDRTSFSSIKESHSAGVAQTFTDSKTSSYLRHQLYSKDDEDAILDDASSSGSKTPESREGRVSPAARGMITNPSSMLHGFVCPCDSFKGWKGIAIRGKIASKSYGDLKGLGMRYDWDMRGGDRMDVDGEEGKVVKIKGRYPPGKSPLENLPMELLGESCFFHFLRILRHHLLQNLELNKHHMMRFRSFSSVPFSFVNLN